ncbi:uncharacterized protein LOC143887133 isoform X2 [Tasmannia lanceolata]|uniref:uncharacterized protein LOC143887133 isoform X2 n=1 Tax=Tasmannia lanceolata TaxID=3420 RepID=UPI00406448B6
MERREERRASFVLHIDGTLKDVLSFEYVGGKMLPLIVGRRAKYRDFDNLIHSKIGTNRSDVSLFIKCRYVFDPSHIILYDIRDDNDLDLVMMLFDSTVINTVSLYVTKEFRFGGNNSPEPTIPSSFAEASRPNISTVPVVPASPIVTAVGQKEKRTLGGIHTIHRYEVDLNKDFEDPTLNETDAIETDFEKSQPGINDWDFCRDFGGDIHAIDLVRPNEGSNDDDEEDFGYDEDDFGYD